MDPRSASAPLNTIVESHPLHDASVAFCWMVTEMLAPALAERQYDESWARWAATVCTPDAIRSRL